MSRGGFTLLEVMVAVAILALSLTAIFSSEAGAAKMAHKSRKMGIACLLVRCKMGEIEEQIASEGLPAIFDSGSDDCCEDAEVDGFSCRWEINPIVLPDTMFGGDEDQPYDEEPEQEESTSPGMGDIDPMEMLGGGAMDGVAMMAMELAYPVLKPSFEAQIRRATVTVTWKEGSREHGFDVTQYLVAEQPPAIINDTIDEMQDAADEKAGN